MHQVFLLPVSENTIFLYNTNVCLISMGMEIIVTIFMLVSYCHRNQWELYTLLPSSGVCPGQVLSPTRHCPWPRALQGGCSRARNGQWPILQGCVLVLADPLRGSGSAWIHSESHGKSTAPCSCTTVHVYPWRISSAKLSLVPRALGGSPDDLMLRATFRWVIALFRTKKNCSFSLYFYVKTQQFSLISQLYV